MNSHFISLPVFKSNCKLRLTGFLKGPVALLGSIPSEAEFVAAAKVGNVVALSSTIHFDQETAITLASRFLGEEHFFLLESATAGPGGIARFSFLGFDPMLVYKSVDGISQVEATRAQKMHFDFKGHDPFKNLEIVMAHFQLAIAGESRKKIDGFDLCSLGGVVGYFSYDCARLVEPSVGELPPAQLGLPEAYFFLPKNLLILDQLSRKLTFVRNVYIADKSAGALREQYQEEQRTLNDQLDKLKYPHIAQPLRTKDAPLDFNHFATQVSEQDFLAKVDQCLEQIKKGEIFQVQIGNRLSLQTSAHGFDIFRHLRILNPSPYMVYYRFGKQQLVCASPEMMVNTQGRKLMHRPIAGTRRRTWDFERDKIIKEELLHDEKERAEHVMLVDLSRNDIGRISEAGSVHVDELMVVEEYSHVFHLVSQVSGTLRTPFNAFDAMIASFPNGTVCGAPKIRAMQIINELETCAREFYAGSLGIFNFAGDLKSTLLIRTIHVCEGKASTQASAGIVYDSIPKHEWQETRNKMAACLLAMQNTL